MQKITVHNDHTAALPPPVIQLSFIIQPIAPLPASNPSFLYTSTVRIQIFIKTLHIRQITLTTNAQQQQRQQISIKKTAKKKVLLRRGEMRRINSKTLFSHSKNPFIAFAHFSPFFFQKKKQRQLLY